MVAELHQCGQEAEDRGEVSGLFFRSCSQTSGHPDRLGYRAVDVGFLTWFRERRIVGHEGDQPIGAEDPADRLPHLAQNDLPNGLVGQSVEAEADQWTGT